MKKLVVAIATTGVMLSGVAAVNVSAEEYEVKERDTLWGIASKYDTSVQSLVDLNGLDSMIIQPGQKIEISEVDKQEKTTDSHKVVKGDTLSGISSKYNVTIDELIEWNNLPSTLIVIGQELKLNQTNVTQEESTPEVVEEEQPANEAQNNETEQEPEPEAVEEPAEQQSESTSEAAGETISVTATAYTAGCEGCSGVTSTGIDLKANPNEKVIAVDPNVIPLGTKVHVEGYGNAVAADVGGAIKGDKIDVHVPTKDEAYSWGVKTVNVTILD